MPPVMINQDKGYSFGNEPISVNKTGEWRFLTPKKIKKLSPCSQGCLLDGEIPDWMEAVKKEEWAEAWNIMKRNNPFPALTGYVCFHPCSENCNRGQLDQELDIQAVEKKIGLWRLNNYKHETEPCSFKGRVAVVGSGPAGLSCAFYLTEAGYEVTVYEKSDLIGGMLALGIPEYRLPRKVLEQELQLLKNKGIIFITNSALGSDYSLADLYSKYDQVFVATGAWVARKALIPGEENKGVWNALELLSAYNRSKIPDLKNPVVVVGGGNAAVDSARSALRLPGVNQVSLVYRRGRIEMPADQSEVEAAEKEGVELIFNATPRKIETDQNQLSEIIFDYSKTNLNGLIIDCNKSFKKECKTVIMAVGQNADLSVLGLLDEAKTFIAGGDMISGPATVADAIRAGRIAAETIKSFLEGLPGPLDDPKEEVPILFEELNLAARLNMQPLKKQVDPVSEAGRCLGCGTCNSCGICYLFCPDLAVDNVGGRYEFNLDYCKGCGICVKECPARALVMEGGSE